MSAFDTECPRCHGKGMAPAPQIQTATVAPPAPPQASPSAAQRRRISWLGEAVALVCVYLAAHVFFTSRDAMQTQVTSRPSTVIAPVAVITPTPVAEIKNPVTQAELDYLNVASNSLGKVVAAEKSLGSPLGYVELVTARAAIEQASAEYSQTPVPPSFTQVDVLIREGLSNEIGAFQNLEWGIKFNDDDLLKRGRDRYVNSSALIKKAFAELRSHATALRIRAENS